MNGRIRSEGRVEICFSGNWGTICHYGWGEPDAAVVCRQLGYPTTGKGEWPFCSGGRGRPLKYDRGGLYCGAPPKGAINDYKRAVHIFCDLLAHHPPPH